MLTYLNMLALLVHLTTTTIEARVKVKVERERDKVKNILGSGLERGTFFTKENVFVNTTIITCKRWEYKTLRYGKKKLKCVKESTICTKVTPEVWDKLPSISPRSWGTCAVVAFGNNLLTQPRGEEIDSYDTVIRLGNVPLSPFRKEAGEKFSFLYVRDFRLVNTSHEFHDEDLYGFRVSELRDFQRPKALIYDSFRPSSGSFGWLSFAFGGDVSEPAETALNKIFSIVSNKLEVSRPTSGTLLAFILLFSGYCGSLGIFGISGNAGPRYWDENMSKKKINMHPSVLQSDPGQVYGHGGTEMTLKEFCRDKRKDRLKLQDPRYKKKGYLNQYCRKKGFGVGSGHNTLLEAQIWKLIEGINPPINGVNVTFYD